MTTKRVVLPGRSGFEVCQELKFHRDTNLIPILMMTARSDVESRRKFIQENAKDVRFLDI